MHDVIKPVHTPSIPLYDGLRATAEEYFALPDDEFRYELIDGVILMSPSPATNHQYVASQIFLQISHFLSRSNEGIVLYETDIVLGSDLVYRPEIIFVRSSNVARSSPRITFAPDLVVEVVSPESRARDTKTKYADYERYGILEYWLVDPCEDSIRLLRRSEDGRFVDVTPTGSEFASSAVPGFMLDLAAIRKSFLALGGPHARGTK